MAAADPVFDELYREVILDHYRRPRNRHRLAEPTVSREGVNPVCGDEVVLDLRLEDGIIREAGFDGMGCSISLASASMLTEQITGHTTGEAVEIADEFTAMLTRSQPATDAMGDLAVLEGVAQFPARVKCALLCCNVLRESLGEEKRATPHKEMRHE